MERKDRTMKVDVVQIDIVSNQVAISLKYPDDFTEVYEYQTNEDSVRYVLFKGNILAYSITDNVPVVVQYRT
jgi:hypothetical protein